MKNRTSKNRYLHLLHWTMIDSQRAFWDEAKRLGFYDGEQEVSAWSSRLEKEMTFKYAEPEEPKSCGRCGKEVTNA